MNTTTISLIAIFIIAIFLFRIKIEKQKIRTTNIPVQKKKNLMSNAELSFYHTLKQIIDDEIFCKCRMEDILYIKNCPKKEIYRNKIKSRHIDFVICDRMTSEIKYVIELDDATHTPENENDIFKNEICKKAGIILIRVKAQRTYNIQNLKNLLDKVASSAVNRNCFASS